MAYLRRMLAESTVAPPATHVPVSTYLVTAGLTIEQYAAARLLGLPEPLEVVAPVDGVMASTCHVRLEAAAEWFAEFDRAFGRRAEPHGPLVMFDRGADNRILLSKVLTALRWTPEQHTEAVRLFRFPRAQYVDVSDADGMRTVPVLRRHELTTWLEHVRQLAPAFASGIGAS
jgi:hypothetical protein